jgi:tRNA pseudouridine38-40 synthase
LKRHTYRVQVAYDGNAFKSFAPVPGEKTVWSTIREALISVVPGFGKLASAGRTDKSVHATGQIVSFIARDKVDPDIVFRALDEAAPGELAALDVRLVNDSFHAQFTATYRRYIYLHEDDGRSDAARIDRLLCPLLGKRDFNAYARETPAEKKTVKTLFDARARRYFDGEKSYVRFDFAGDAFLRRQVRVMVATALREAEGSRGDNILLELAENLDRRETALPAPGAGLYLVKVGYDAIKKRT